MTQILPMLMFAFWVTAGAQQVLSARSRMMLHHVGDNTVQAFVRVDDASLLDSMAAAGVTVNTLTGDVATVQLTRDQALRLASLRGVKAISLAQRLTLTNDSARLLSDIDPVLDGELGSQAYTGKGVIVGMIDTGVDFNHINLCDEQGHSRVIAAYLPCDDNGEAPIVDGLTLPGSHYITPEDIAGLTTDNNEESHGTHTTGTAAGSYQANGWHGVAPDADLVICAMPESELTDVNVANSVRYIFDVAKREDKPCVINMSLANDVGPHDGTSMLCRLFDEVSGPGRICVVSAANSGARACVIDYTFKSDTDTITTCIAPYTSLVNGRFSSYVSVWSRDEHPHFVIFTATSKSTGELLCSWQVPRNEDGDTCYYDLSQDEFGKYFAEGYIIAANGVEDCNGNYHTLAEFMVKALDDDITLGMRLVGPEGTRIDAWGGSGVVFTRYSHSYMRAGSQAMTINDMATCDEAISVGAYCSRKYMPAEDGSYITNTRSVVGDIAYFSSYGPDLRGIARPDVTAPGFSLVSSASRYDVASLLSSTWRAPGVTVDDVYYPYASQYGTSMSTPIVVGAIALWLQIDSTLAPTRIRELMAETSVQDAYVLASPQKWGSGKLNVAAATQLLLQEAAVNDVEINSLDIRVVDGNIVVSGLDGEAQVVVADLQGRVVAQRKVNGDASISLDDLLAHGFYVVTATSARDRVSNKIIIK